MPRNWVIRFGPMSKQQKLNILVVDDEASIRRLLPALFQRAGYSVETASNGEEALSVVSHSANGFEVVITDHEMPVLRGDQMVQSLRANGFRGAIFVCSAYLTPDITAHYRRLGVRECLSKPVPWEELKMRVAVIAADRPS